MNKALAYLAGAAALACISPAFDFESKQERPFQGRCKGGNSFASREKSPRFKRRHNGAMRLKRKS